MAATPITEMIVYGTEPLYKEVGPIEMDSQIESSAETYLEMEDLQLKFKIESLQMEYDTEKFSFPCEGAIQIMKADGQINMQAKNRETGELEVLISTSITEIFPHITLQKWTNNIMDTKLSDNASLKLSCKNNVERDIYALCMRIVVNEKLMQLKPEDEEKDDEQTTMVWLFPHTQ